MRYAELKGILYATETMFGLLLLVLGLIAPNTPDQVIAKLLLMVMGTAVTMFGIITYMLRDEPDIWM